MSHIDADILDSFKLLRYRERLKLSHHQLMQEPIEAVHEALLIWDLQAERDKLEEDRQRQKQSAGRQ